jgi:transposase
MAPFTEWRVTMRTKTMKTREPWRGGLRLTKAENLQITNALRKTERLRQHRFAKKLRGILLVGQERLTQRSAGRVLGVSGSAITRWVMAYSKGGIERLRPRKAPGAKSRLSDRQKVILRKLIVRGPEACGYDTGVWDGPLVRHLIEKRFHVKYSVCQVRVVMHKLNLSVKRPKHPSSEGSEKLKRKWLRKNLPEIKKQAESDHGIVAVEDECGFKQSGTLTRTWGPIGEDFDVRSKPGRASCRVFGLTTLSENPAFHFRFEKDPFNAATFTRFLEQVTAEFSARGEKLHLILDGAPCHTGAKKWAESHSAQIALHFLPPYSPELNPQEQVWRVTKRRATHDRYFATPRELHDTVKRRFNRYQGNPAALRSIIRPWV